MLQDARMQLTIRELQKRELVQSKQSLTQSRAVWEAVERRMRSTCHAELIFDGKIGEATPTTAPSESETAWREAASSEHFSEATSTSTKHVGKVKPSTAWEPTAWEARVAQLVVIPLPSILVTERLISALDLLKFLLVSTLVGMMDHC